LELDTIGGKENRTCAIDKQNPADGIHGCGLQMTRGDRS
jgi:hypothetical protein